MVQESGQELSVWEAAFDSERWIKIKENLEV